MCKRAIKKALKDGHDVDTALQSYLMTYRNVEHSTTGASPAMLLQRRNLRTRLDLLKDSQEVNSRVREAQRCQVQNAGGAAREFRVGDKVWMRGYGGGKKWLSGQIDKKLGSRNYIITSQDGPPIKRHVDQIKGRWISEFELPSPNGPSSEVATDVDPVVPPAPAHIESGAGARRAGAPEHLPDYPHLEVGRSVTGPLLRPRPCKPPSRYGVD